MTRPPRRWDRGMLVGSAVCAAFGAAWSLWAAAGLPDVAAVVCRVVGVLTAVAVLVADLLRWRRPTAASSSGALVSRRYWAVNAAELVLVVGGSALLQVAGRPELVIAWTSAVVGAHFLVFGRWFWRGFAVLGGWLVLGALVGVALGVPRPALAVPVTGVVAAVGLLGCAVVMPYRGRPDEETAPPAR